MSTGVFKKAMEIRADLLQMRRNYANNFLLRLPVVKQIYCHSYIKKERRCKRLEAMSIQLDKYSNCKRNASETKPTNNLFDNMEIEARAWNKKHTVGSRVIGMHADAIGMFKKEEKEDALLVQREYEKI
ncbi:MAG: hypothetical protein N4A47_00445 [Clostridia bacterium]|jgi:hypothetical protein|nr:hypothetical protein [Clostridia bacterium]